MNIQLGCRVLRQWVAILLLVKVYSFSDVKVGALNTAAAAQLVIRVGMAAVN